MAPPDGAREKNETYREWGQGATVVLLWAVRRVRVVRRRQRETTTWRGSGQREREKQEA